MPKFFLPAAIFLFFPFFSQAASVEISEVAWMGTSNSAQDEWIELYSGSGASLEGWVLKTADGAMTISLAGKIQPGGYFLIERTDDSTLPEIAADLIAPFGSGLSNSGEILILADSAGAEVYKIDASAGWPAGDNTTKETMQKIESAWKTAPQTPKAPNAAAPEHDAEPDQSSSNTNSSSNSQTPASPKVFEEPKIKAEIKSPQSGIAGADVFFEGRALGFDGKKITADKYIWSFGDGGHTTGGAIKHAYKYPGNYHISLSVSSGEFSVSAYSKIEIIPNQMALSEISPREDSWVEIYNGSSAKLDIGGWILSDTYKKFVLPPETFILPKTYIVISEELSAINLLVSGRVELLYPSGSVADVFEYSGEIKEGESFNKKIEGVKILKESPGESADSAEPVKPSIVLSSAPVKKLLENNSGEDASQVKADEPETVSLALSSDNNDSKIIIQSQPANALSFFSGSFLKWSLAVLSIAAIVSLGFVATKRI